jgi:hypothetical protein
MLWSPVVKNQGSRSKINQLRDVEKIQRRLAESHGVQLELVINDRFAECLVKLRKYARDENRELKSPALRLMQIEEKLKLEIAKSIK